jgi:hypothetical protein
LGYVSFPTLFVECNEQHTFDHGPMNCHLLPPPDSIQTTKSCFFKFDRSTTPSVANEAQIVPGNRNSNLTMYTRTCTLHKLGFESFFKSRNPAAALCFARPTRINTCATIYLYVKLDSPVAFILLRLAIIFTMIHAYAHTHTDTLPYSHFVLSLSLLSHSRYWFHSTVRSFIQSFARPRLRSLDS